MQNIIKRVKAEILGTNNVHLVNDPVLHAWINLVKEPRPSNFSSLQRQKQITNLATKFHLIKWIKTSNNQKEQETNESPMKLSIYILWELRGSSLRSYRIALRRNPARINGLPSPSLSLPLPPSLCLSVPLCARSMKRKCAEGLALSRESMWKVNYEVQSGHKCLDFVNCGQKPKKN